MLKKDFNMIYASTFYIWYHLVTRVVTCSGETICMSCGYSSGFTRCCLIAPLVSPNSSYSQTWHTNFKNKMISVLASSVVDRGFEPRSGQIKDYKIGMCCFSSKHAALRRKSKDWLARTQNNVSKGSDMSIRGLLFQWASTIKIQLSVLV